MLTQLIFEHALRLRVKSETASTPTPSAISTPDTASNAETVVETAIDDESESAASHPIEESSSTAVSSSPELDNKEATNNGDGNNEKGSNFAGRLNNLVATDLQSIGRGRDFTMVTVYTPVTIAISLYFLYRVLGWRYAFPLSLSSNAGVDLMVPTAPLSE